MVESSAKNILATVLCNTRDEAFSDEWSESPESRFLLPTFVNHGLSARLAVFPAPKAIRQFTKKDCLAGILAGRQSLTDIETIIEVWS